MTASQILPTSVPIVLRKFLLRPHEKHVSIASLEWKSLQSIAAVFAANQKMWICFSYWYSSTWHHQRLWDPPKWWKTKEFLNIINKHNIFALVETHATYDSEPAINNFEHFVKCTNKSGKRTFGGLSLYINQTLANGVSYIPTENKNTIWCKLDRNYFGFKNDIYLGTVYLSPPNYERNNNDDLMLSFSQRVALSYKVILMQEQVMFKKS